MNNVLQFKKKAEPSNEELLKRLVIANIETTYGDDGGLTGLTLFAMEHETNNLWLLIKSCQEEYIKRDENGFTHPDEFDLTVVPWDQILFVGSIVDLDALVSVININRRPPEDV